ncbi:MAG: hypothetical protein KAI84_07640 [Gammaproteobacteria bacterium]|nr:hypothetical protein [Gammaproteobacteria bacterium]
MVDKLKIPEIKMSDEELNIAGFTNSGAPQFNETVEGYSRLLFERAIHFSDVDKATNLPREITHDHVRAAAHSIANSYGKPTKSKWSTVGQIGEYVAIAIVGVGGSNLDNQYGVLVFGVGLLIAVVLIVARLTKTKSEW